MGYYTRYELDIIENNSEVSDVVIIQGLRDFSEGANYSIDEYGECYNDTKWYDYEKDLKYYSSQYPNVLFCLNGEGEESGDIWKHYFKNGSSKYCPAKITFGSVEAEQKIDIDEIFGMSITQCSQCASTDIIDNKCGHCGSKFK